MHTPQNIAAMTGSVCEVPSTSIHRRSQQLTIGMTPYKVQLVQELKPIDHPMRFHFDKWEKKKNCLADPA